MLSVVLACRYLTYLSTDELRRAVFYLCAATVKDVLLLIGTMGDSLHMMNRSRGGFMPKESPVHLRTPPRISP